MPTIALTVPRIDRAYPVRQSPHYRDVVDDFHGWFLSHGLHDTPERRRSFVAKDYPYLVSIAWPACDQRLLWDIAAIAAALTERDDEYDRQRQTKANPLWVPLFKAVWSRFAHYVPVRQMSRLTDVVSAYSAGCADQFDGNLIQSDISDPVTTYLSTRYFSVGQLIDHVLVEISLGIDIGDVLDDSLMAELVRLDVARVIACQDLLSLPKDLREGERDNLVLVIADSTGCSLQEAVDQAGDYLRTKMTDFDAQAARVLASPLGQRRDVRQFVKGLNDFTAGLIEWTSCSARYTGAATSTWSTTPIRYRAED